MPRCSASRALEARVVLDARAEHYQSVDIVLGDAGILDAQDRRAASAHRSMTLEPGRWPSAVSPMPAMAAAPRRPLMAPLRIRPRSVQRHRRALAPHTNKFRPPKDRTAIRFLPARKKRPGRPGLFFLTVSKRKTTSLPSPSACRPGLPAPRRSARTPWRRCRDRKSSNAGS